MPSLLAWLSHRSLRFLHALGTWLGWTAYLLSPSYRHRLVDNARLAGVGSADRRAAVAEAGKLYMELPRLWLRPRDQPIADPVRWQGAELIEASLAGGRGLVLLTPHMGSFEICAQAYAERFGGRQPITVLYRPARQPWLAEMMLTARNRPGIQAVPTTLQGVRQMLKALRRGEAVGLLPDQVPPDGQGLWAPFFGKNAYSMTLAARLALQTGATVVLARCERLPAGRGHELFFEPLPAPLPQALPPAVEHINQAMEHLIRQCPTQYLWGYGRYKQPHGEAPAAPEEQA